MKYSRKYNVDLEEIYKKHIDGYSLPELSIEYNIPRTTLNRYLDENGYTIYFNRHKGLINSIKYTNNNS